MREKHQISIILPLPNLLGQTVIKHIEERFDRRYVWQELKAFYRKSLEC